MRGPVQVTFDTQQKMRDIQQVAGKVKLPDGARAAFVTFFKNEGIRSTMLVKAAAANGIHSDDFKKAAKSLSFHSPKGASAYMLATAQAIAGILKLPYVVPNAKKFVAQVMAAQGVTDAERTTALRNQADAWWKEANPPSTGSAYYHFRDLANLN